MIENIFKEYGFTLSQTQLEKLRTYFEFLVEYNENVNLTALTSEEDVYVKHFLDSLLIFKDMDVNDKRILDLGAGAGFPSVPNAIIYPDTQFVIIETLGKRCVFLELLIKKLELNNIKVLNKRGEDISESEIESFDICCARAVAKANVLLELLAKYTKINGFILLPKANLESSEKTHALGAAKKLKLDYLKTISYEFESNQRNNMLFLKQSKTPYKYPRNFGQIKKSPLI